MGLSDAIMLFGVVAFLGWGFGHIIHRAGRIPDFLT